MPAIWKTQQWPQNWKRSVFIPIPKKGNAKECSNYCTIALISHSSKVMLKILKPVFSNMWTVNFLMFKLVLEKAEEPEIKLPTSTGSWKKQESSRKASISALSSIHPTKSIFKEKGGWFKLPHVMPNVILHGTHDSQVYHSTTVFSSDVEPTGYAGLFSFWKHLHFSLFPTPFLKISFIGIKSRLKKWKEKMCYFYFVLQNCVNGDRKDCKLVRWTESST